MAKKENTIKRKTRQIVTAYRILDKASIKKLESDEKFPYLMAVRPMREITEKFDADFKDAQNRLKPEGFDAIAEKFNARQELTPDEQSAFRKYDRELGEVSETDLNKEVEIELKPLKHETFARLIDSNDWDTGQIFALTDAGVAEL